ncbi:MAG: cation:proton antiporter [Acidilobaceae archaeon]|nr:cation:proton antiporter [Acidilobaceae archaeon]
MGILELASASVALAVILGFVSDRLGLSPFPGFLMAGLLIRWLSESAGLPAFFGVEQQAIYEISSVLLLFSSILIAFEVGRELGSVGFEIRAAYLVGLEAAAIIGMTLAATRVAGLSTVEGLVIALAFLSSSTVTVYRLIGVLGSEEAKKVALTMTAAEDLALLAALGLISGRGDPLAVFVLTVLFALVAAPLFHLVFRYIQTTEEYRALIALSLTLAFASVAQYYASPHLGAFVAGYVFGRSLGGKGVLGPLVDIIAMLYLVSAGVSTPISALGSEIFVLLALVALAVAVRVISVFLAALITLGSTYYALVLSMHMASISELSPLIALSAYSAGLVKDAIAVPLVLLPLATIAVSSLASRHWRGIAFAAEGFMVRRGLTQKVRPLISSELYELGRDVAVSSAKMSGALLAVPLALFLLERLGLDMLLNIAIVAPLIILVAAFVYKEYRKIMEEISAAGELPKLLLRGIAAIAVFSISSHTLLEVTEGSPLLLLGAFLVTSVLLVVLLADVIVRVLKLQYKLISAFLRGRRGERR